MKSLPTRLFSLLGLAVLLVLALGMFGWQNAVQTAHAMDCEIDCYSGLPPTEGSPRPHR